MAAIPCWFSVRGKLLGGATLVLCGATCIALSLGWSFREGRSAREVRRGWSTVQGVVTSSEADSSLVEHRDFRVEFDYVASGTPYHGSQEWDVSNGGAGSAKRRFPPSATVTVYYDPRNPVSSVVDRDKVDGGWSGIIRVAVFSAGFLTALFGMVSVAEATFGRAKYGQPDAPVPPEKGSPP